MRGRETRFWGDGGGDARPHVVEDSDFLVGFIRCRCGVVVQQGLHLSIEDAWDAHRGIEVGNRATVHRAARLATDREVHVFLESISEGEKEAETDLIDVEYRP